jgi:hypothetical protein
MNINNLIYYTTKDEKTSHDIKGYRVVKSRKPLSEYEAISILKFLLNNNTIKITKIESV